MIVASISPKVDHLIDVIQHPLVSALRFNTSIPINEPKIDILRFLKEKCGEKRLWLDLKTRQLQVINVAFTSYVRLKINHSISTRIPFKIHYRDLWAPVVDIEDGNVLVLGKQPPILPEPGETVNILHPSLKVDCFLSGNDLEYIEAAKKCGFHHYMLSFVESEEDLKDLLGYDMNAEIIAKIESQKGIQFIKKSLPISFQRLRLMAARNDLFVHMGAKKIEIITALRIIIKKDPKAIVASHILPSLEANKGIAMGDLSDLLLLKILGFRNFLLSDSLCSRKENFEHAMEVWQEFMLQVKKHEESLRRKSGIKYPNNRGE